MPTMSSSLTLANSTSSSDLSSPPNTRCRSCLAGRLGVSAARMINLRCPISCGDLASHRMSYRQGPTSHLPFHLSASEAFCGKVRLRSLKTAAQELTEKSRHTSAGGTGASHSRPHFSGGLPAAAIPPAPAHHWAYQWTHRQAKSPLKGP